MEKCECFLDWTRACDQKPGCPGVAGEVIIEKTGVAV